MKKVILVFTLVLTTLFGFSQISITLVPSSHYGSNISCAGGNDGSISAVPTGGNGEYTYEWSSGPTTQTIDGLTAGAYTVTVTDADATTAVESIELQQPNTLQLSLTAYEYGGGTNISQHGASDGSISSQVSGGTSPYLYSWSSNETSEEISGLATGAFSLTVTDENGCSAIQSKTLTEPTALVITSLTSPQHNGYEISCADENDGEINLEISGGIPPYEYQWSNGSFDQNPVDLPAGSYDVAVYDKNGASVTSHIVLHQPEPIKLKLSAYEYPNDYNLSTYESADGSITAAPTGGVQPYNYQWLYPHEFVVTGPNLATISNLLATTYALILTDANGCRTSDKVNLNQPQADAELQINFNVSKYYNSNVSCFDASDGSIKTIMTGGSPPYTYLWSNNATTKNLDNIPAGSYALLVRDRRGNTTTESAKLLKPWPLEVAIDKKDVSSQGKQDGLVQTIVKGGAPPYVFIWNNDTSLQKPSLERLGPGQYTVVVTDMNGCSVSSIVSITEPTPLQVTINILKQVSCNVGDDGSLTFSISGGIPPYDYRWSNGAEADTLDSLKGGWYGIDVKDDNGAFTKSSVYLTDPQPVKIKTEVSEYPIAGTANIADSKIIPGVSCFGCNDGSISVTAIDPPDIHTSYTYEWDTTHTAGISERAIENAIHTTKPNPEGDDVVEFNWFTGSSTLENLAPGFYFVQVTNVNGCVARDVIHINPQDRDDWSIYGNKNIHPEFQFIGSTDETDVSFKTNNIERARIAANGDFRITNLADTDTIPRIVFVDRYGNLNVRRPNNQNDPCPTPTSNWLTDYCNNQDIYNSPSSGRVGIGTSYIPNGYKLAVDGKIICEEVKVKQRSSWPDYVFTKDYVLPSLTKLNEYIQANNHLPELPDAATVEQEGTGLGDMQTKLVKKVEELTLYLIQQNTALEKLETQNKLLNKKVNELSKHVSK